jgi:gliding motility-associated-like protein
VNTAGNFGTGFYRCQVNGDFAATVFTNTAQLTVNAIPSKPIITSSIALVGNDLTICSTSTLMLSAPNGFSLYNWSTGDTTSQISVSTSGSYFVTVTDGSGCSSQASDAITVIVLPAPCSNQPPVITTTSVSTVIGGQATINLLDLISDADDNLVLTSLVIIQSPNSGAIATITNGILEIDYKGINFSGRDQLTIQVCDVFGECAQQILEIDVIGEIEIYNGLSPNNDNLNEVFLIRYIDLIPETQNNKVTIYNRWGSKVFEVGNYNNTTNVFSGLNDNGNELPSGTYFYKIVFNSGRKSEAGYLTLKR